MKAWWNALDFGRQQDATCPSGEGEEITIGRLHDVVAGAESPVAMVENGLVEEEGPEADNNSPPSFNPRLFRPPSTSVKVLRQLSRDGRKETLRAEAEEEAMGREKIVWGHLENGGILNSEIKEVLEDGSSALTITGAPEIGTVDVVKQTSREEE